MLIETRPGEPLERRTIYTRDGFFLTKMLGWVRMLHEQARRLDPSLLPEDVDYNADRLSHEELCTLLNEARARYDAAALVADRSGDRGGR